MAVSAVGGSAVELAKSESCSAPPPCVRKPPPPCVRKPPPPWVRNPPPPWVRKPPPPCVRKPPPPCVRKPPPPCVRKPPPPPENPYAPARAPIWLRLIAEASLYPLNGGSGSAEVLPLKLTSCHATGSTRSGTMRLLFQSMGEEKVLPSTRTTCAPSVIGVPSQCMVA